MTGNVSELVAAAVSGHTLTQIAAAAGVSVSTAQRRLKDPDVLALVSDARAQGRAETLGRLTQLRTTGLDRLADLLDSDDPTVVLRALTLIMNVSTKLDLVVDLDQRLTALEAAPFTNQWNDQEMADHAPVD